MDDLSDLSENEASSDLSCNSSDESSEGDQEGGCFDEEGHFIIGKKPKAKRRTSKVRMEAFLW